MSFIDQLADFLNHFGFVLLGIISIISFAIHFNRVSKQRKEREKKRQKKIEW